MNHTEVIVDYMQEIFSNASIIPICGNFCSISFISLKSSDEAAFLPIDLLHLDYHTKK